MTQGDGERYFFARTLCTLSTCFAALLAAGAAQAAAVPVSAG